MEEMQKRENHWRAFLNRLEQAWQVIWPIARQMLGWLLIFLGILGLILPFLQGFLFLAIGIAMVGRRNPIIRRVSVYFKLFLHRWALLQTPLIGPLGRLALRAQQESSRQLRRIHWRYAEYRERRAQRRTLSHID